MPNGSSVTVQLKSAAAKQRFLKLGWLTLKGKLCIPVDLNWLEGRVMLHRLPFAVPNEVLLMVLEKFGSTGEVNSKKWRVDDFEDVE